MVQVWRAAGLTYIDYSRVAARWLRQALKTRNREEEIKRDNPVIKITPYEGGTPQHDKAF